MAPHGLVIRKEQMEALSRYQAQSFAHRMAAHLDRTYPGVIQDKYTTTTQAFVAAGIEKAERYRIEYEDDIQAFLEMRVRLGPDFDTDSRYPWAQQVLTDPQRDGSAKMEALDEHETFGL